MHRPRKSKKEGSRACQPSVQHHAWPAVHQVCASELYCNPWTRHNSVGSCEPHASFFNSQTWAIKLFDWEKVSLNINKVCNMCITCSSIQWHVMQQWNNQSFHSVHPLLSRSVSLRDANRCTATSHSNPGSSLRANLLEITFISSRFALEHLF